MSPLSGPLSTAVTRSPRCASCHVQPPGAAPRSTARIPACRRSSSRSPRNAWIASTSFSVERDGAPAGMRSRGMPIVHRLPHGARLAPTKTCAPSTKSTCSAGRSGAAVGNECACVAQVLGQRFRDRFADARQLLAVVGVGGFEMKRSEDEMPPRRVRRARQRKVRANCVGQARQAAPRDRACLSCVRRRTAECGPVAKEQRADEHRRRL